MVVLAIGLLTATTASLDAAVLCANPSGSVFVRDECKNSETQLDLAALGLVGPPGPPGPGVKTIAGFIYADGAKYGNGFTVTKLAPGKWELLFPIAQFSDFPAVAVSAWGFPGVAPTRTCS